jgi:hypothetical protein
MDLKTHKNPLIIKSIVWNTIIEVFKREKSIDITDKLISITINKNSITVKTQTPLINAELKFLDETIQKEIQNKIDITNFQIRYV